jgi:hypothetical protein
VLRLDVAVVGFVIFTLIAPLGGGYLAAWLVDPSASRPIVAVLGGGTNPGAIAAALGSALALATTLRFTAGSVFDSFVGAWPENEALLTNPGYRLMTLGNRYRNREGDEIDEEGPVGLGGAVGWVGSAVGAVLIAGMSLAAWPPVDPGQLERIGAGTGSAIDWIAAAFPVVARIIVASIVGILAGAAWSTFGGPAARMEALEDDVEGDLDDLSVVDAPGPDAPSPGAAPPGAAPG